MNRGYRLRDLPLNDKEAGIWEEMLNVEFDCFQRGLRVDVHTIIALYFMRQVIKLREEIEELKKGKVE